MQAQKVIYEGKGKKLFDTENPSEVIAEFKDDLTAFNAQKRGNEKGKGALNCQISTELFKLLENAGIATHFIKRLGEDQMLCKRVKIIPIEVVTRNIATGSLTKRLRVAEGTPINPALVEFYYKDDALEDPLINDDHALLLQCVAKREELEFLRKKAREINTILREFFDSRGLNLVDFKLEFGKDSEGNILLADEISPDSCRFWDKKTNEKLDKDRFRQDLGSVKVAYEEVLRRILS